MSKLAKIIRYFASHDVSDALSRRVWKRLEGPIDSDAEKEFQQLWEESGTVESVEADKSWLSVARTLGIRQKASWAVILRRAAIWIVPVVMLFGAGWLYYDARQQQQILAQTIFMQEFCANGEQRHLFLPDSTEVWLNGGSVLVYPSTFVGGSRHVTLVGEAYFKVRHDAKAPFQVSVNHLRVNDIGTEFNVQSYPNQDKTVVTLQAGAVSVDVHGKKYQLNPNQQLSFFASTGKADITAVTAEDYSTWRTGAIFFSDEPLGTVLTKLEYSYDVRFHLQTSHFDNQRVRLHLNPHEKLQNVMSLVATIVPGLKYEIRGRDVYIR